MNLEQEQKLLKEVDAVVNADRLLNDEVFVGAVDSVRTAIYEAWSKSPVRDMEGQHELRLLLKLLDDLTGHIGSAAKDGRFAAETLRQGRKFAQRVKDSAREFTR